MPEGWAKIPQAARFAGVSPRTIRSWLKAGLNHSRLHSGTVLISLTDLDGFLRGFSVKDDRLEGIVQEALLDLKEKAVDPKRPQAPAPSSLEHGNIWPEEKPISDAPTGTKGSTRPSGPRSGGSSCRSGRAAAEGR